MTKEYIYKLGFIKIFFKNVLRDGEDMWTQGLFISMYDRIHYK